jgi:uncharacterized delta-60 repeat protein
MKSMGIRPRWMYASGGAAYSRKAALATLLTITWPGSSVLSAPGGELDTTFGENGLVRIVAGIGAKAVARQSTDGKLVVAGSFPSADGWSDFAVIRLNLDGSFDESFGQNGVATVDFDGRGDEATALALQPDGKIVVAGMAYPHTNASRQRLAVARLNPNGFLDITFGSAGRVMLDVPAESGYLADIGLAEDGRLVIIGSAWGLGGGDFLARLDANGELDSTFGTGPIAGTTVIEAGLSGGPAALIRQPDGKYIECGTLSNGWDPPSNMGAVRINPDGSLDKGFGKDGLWYLPKEGLVGNSSAGACLGLPDGTLVIAGQVERDGVQAALVRLRADGVLDTASWASGIATIDVGGNATVSAIVALEDRRLVIAGTVYWGALTGPRELGGYTYPISDGFIAQVDVDTGRVDPNFGDRGVTIIDFGRGDLPAWTQTVDLIRQSDGKFVSAAGVLYHDALDTQWGQDDYERLTAIVLARIDPQGAGSPGLVGFADAYASVDENAGMLSVEVKRTGGSTGHVLVDYATVGVTASSPSDFTATSGTLTWLSGDTESKLIMVPINDDTAAEGEEWFRIDLSSSSGPTAISSATVWIADDESPPVTPSDAPPVTLPSFSQGGGGGGAFGLETLLLIVSAIYWRGLGACPRKSVILHRLRQDSDRARAP